jgi:hypothetical protein
MMPSHVYRNAVVAIILVSALVPPKAMARDISPGDSVLSFERVQITLFDGDSIRSDAVEIAGTAVVMRDYKPLKSQFSTGPRSAEVVRELDLQAVERLEVRKNHASTGAGLGAFAGLGTFALLLAVGLDELNYGVVAVDALAMGALFSLVGVVVGATTGSAFRHWETVYDAESGWDEHHIRSGPEYEHGVGYRRTKTRSQK